MRIVLHHDHERDEPSGRLIRKIQRQRRGVGERAAEQRAGDGGGRPHRADVALVAAALARREEVGDRRLAERDQPARADALQRAERDQLRHGLREPAQRGADQEDRDRDDEQPPAAVEVAELAVQRDGDRGRRAGTR